MLVVISGPSGVGKDTVVNALLQAREHCVESISATTRGPRTGEVHGIDYHFVSKDEFKEFIDNDELLEYTVYSENYYGTLKEVVDQQRLQGNHVFLIIETDGAGQIKKQFPEALCVFLMPPSFDSLKERLALRNTDSQQSIDLRLQRAYEEIKDSQFYDFVVTNDKVTQAVEKLSCIITAAECSPKYSPEILKGAWSEDA